MPDSPNGAPQPTPPKDTKELSMEIRLLIAFILMGAVLFLTPYFYKPAAPPPQASKSVPAAKPPAPGQPAAAAPAEPPPPVGQIRRRKGRDLRRRYATVPGGALQSRRAGPQLGAQEVPRRCGQGTGPGESGGTRQVRLSVRAGLPESEAGRESRLGVVRGRSRARRPGRDLPLRRRQRPVREVVPFPQGQLPGRDLLRGSAGRGSDPASAGLARRLRRPDHREPRHRPADHLLRRDGEQTRLHRSEGGQGRPGHPRRDVLVRRSRGPVLRGAVSAHQRFEHRTAHVQRPGSRRGEQEGGAAHRLRRGRRGVESLLGLRRSQGPRHSAQDRSETRAGGRLRLVLVPRQAAVRLAQLDQRQDRAQLRLVDRPGDRDHQLPAAAAQAEQPEVGQEDADGFSPRSPPSTPSTRASACATRARRNRTRK